MSQAKMIFFDLDGTLLEMHTDAFVKNYLQELTRHVGERFEAETLIGLLWDATKAMIVSNEPHKTNEEVFTAHFLAKSGLQKEAIWPVFDTFYKEVFPTLAHLAYPSPWGKKIVEAAKSQGFRVAVTTNPVFPKEAIYARLAWVGLTPDEFEHVTVYEEAHYTKPHAGYYQEVCNRLGVEPTACIMVGNHMQEDMVTSTLGMKTFLVTNYMEDRGEPVYQVDQRGTFEELYEGIANRSGIFA